MFNNNKIINWKVIGAGHTDPSKDSRFSLVNQHDFLLFHLSQKGKRNATKKAPEDKDPNLEELEQLAKIAVEKIGFDSRPFFNGPVEDLGLIAALDCLKKNKIKASELDGIIATSNTNGPGYPSLAAHIKAGLAKVDEEDGKSNAWCFDVKAACAGGLSAMQVAISLISTGQLKTVLVVAAEKETELAEVDEFFSSNLFGDASSAILLQASSKNISAGYKFISDPYEGKVDLIGFKKENWKFRQEGRSVHKFVQRNVVTALSDFITKHNLSKKTDHIFIHQPSKKTTELFMEKIGELWPHLNGKIHTDLSTGNISSASVFWVFSKLIASGKVKRGETIIFLSFGAGLEIGIIAFQF